MIKKVFKSMVALTIIALVISVGSIRYVSNTIADDIEDVAEHVGDTVIYGGDTTIIIDYSILSGTYTLQTGSVVSTKLYNLD